MNSLVYFSYSTGPKSIMFGRFDNTGCIIQVLGMLFGEVSEECCSNFLFCPDVMLNLTALSYYEVGAIVPKVIRCVMSYDSNLDSFTEV